MDELDKQLDFYLKKYESGELGDDTSDAINIIKGVFQDAGYVEVRYAPDSRYEHPMTGDEWLARFEKEMQFFKDSSAITPTIALKAAKRAAGLAE